MTPRTCRFCHETFTPKSGRRTYCYAPECAQKYKEYRKAYNLESAQAFNLRQYKKVKIKALNPAKRSCLKCLKPFDSKDETDRFCPVCKKKKQWMVDNHEMTEEY